MERRYTEAVQIDPSSTEVRNIYKLLIGAVVPRPIAFVSSLSSDGVPNLAPFSFFTVVSANPPVICFSPMNRNSGDPYKDTRRNIEATREFVVNVVSEEFAGPMNLCSGEYPPEVDEFVVSGLTPIPSVRVHPARVAESHVQMECRLLQIVPVSERPLGGCLVLGEVLLFHVDESILENFLIDPDRLHAIGRMGGPTYARTTDRFDLQRP